MRRVTAAVVAAAAAAVAVATLRLAPRPAGAAAVAPTAAPPGAGALLPRHGRRSAAPPPPVRPPAARPVAARRGGAPADAAARPAAPSGRAGAAGGAPPPRLPAPADRQTLVSILAALSATYTELTNPAEFGTDDGGGAVGGTLNRTDAAAPRPAAVVTLHGLGGSGPKAVAALRDDVDAATLAYTSVYGPSAGTDGGGNPRSWFPIGAVPVGRVPTADAAAGAAADLAATADRVDAVVAAAERRGVPRARIVLAGYSLGAAAAADFALSGRAGGLAAVLVSGGWTPRPGRVVPPAAAAGVRVVVRHGRLDGLVPFRAATRLRDALAAAGAAVTLEAYPWAGHFLNEYGASEADLAPLLATLLPA